MSLNSLHTTSVTEVVKNKFGHKWVIKNFKDIVKEPGQSIVSSFFFPNSNEIDACFLRLYPNGVSGGKEGYLSIYLVFVSGKKTEEKVMWHASIIDSNNSAAIEKTSAFRIFNSQTKVAEWGWSSFVRKDVLFEETSNLLPNGTLTINCVVEKMADIVTTNEITPIPTPIKIPRSTLASELSFAFRREKFCDVVLKIGERKFRASKAILAARSPVFAGMFSYDNMKENQKNEVNIANIMEDVFEELLYFIYTDTAPNLHEMPEELIAAADFFQLDRLKIMCEKALQEKLSIDNVVEIFVLSEMYNANKLKEETLKFMKGREVETLKTHGYKSLQHSNYYRAWKLCEMLLIGEKMLNLRISPEE